MENLTQREIELKWQKKWKEDKVFEAKIDENKEKFFGTVAYPYANSILHIGHGRGNTAPDLYYRFQRLNGKNVLFPMGFHISGTPVLAVADGIVKGDKKQIKITRDAVSEYVKDVSEIDDLMELFKDPMEIAKFFSGTIQDSFESVGLSIDWSRQFSTGDSCYQKFIEWQFKKLNESGILVQGRYPILYSPVDGNAVGEDDIKDGDTDKVTLSEMKFIKFKLVDSDEFLVAATLRPDSLFGATNLYVKPEMELVKLEVNGDVWIVSKASKVKIEHQFDKVEFISEHLGSEFLDREVIVPILNKKVPVYKMDYPDENHGTGIVYSSPADSPHDYIYLFELKFPGKSLKDFKEDPLKLTPITKTKDNKGNEIKYKSEIPAFDTLLKFKIYNVKGNGAKLEEAKEALYKEAHYGAIMINCQEFDGTPLKGNQGAARVTKRLEELGMGGVFYETSRRAVTRGGDSVIVANLEGQWFLNYKEEEIKEKAYSLLDSMTYLPNKLKDTQKGYLKWVEMRPCARKRGIGTPLPYDKEWVIESLSDSTIYQMLYLVYGIVREENLKPEQLTFEVFDYIFLGNGNKVLISEDTKISEKVIDRMRKEVEYWKSFDFRYTAGAHLSNHLSFLIYHYALIFPSTYHPKTIAVGGMLIRDGEKISKSKGNGIPLVQVPRIFGADLYRLYVAIGSNFDVEMDFRDEDIKQLDNKFNKWKELMFEASNLKKSRYDDFTDINKWLISKFYSRVKNYFEFFENMRIREAFVLIFYEFLNDINYHERRTSYDETLKVLRFILEDYVKVMAPAVSHFCEELWERLGNKTYVSLESFDKNFDTFINEGIEDLENIVYELISSVAREIEKKKNVKKVIIVQAKEDRFILFNKLKELLKNTNDFKKIFSELIKDFEDDKKFIQKFVPKTLGSGLSAYLQRDEERELLMSVLDFLKKEFNVNFEIKLAEEVEFSSVNLIPGRPQIIIKE